MTVSVLKLKTLCVFNVWIDYLPGLIANKEKMYLTHIPTKLGTIYFQFYDLELLNDVQHYCPKNRK